MFGFVVRIRTENWGWVAQHRSTNHRKTKIFNELFLLLEDLRIFLCFWTRMEMFSLAGSIILDSWGTETKMIEIYHRKWKTSLQFHLFPPVIQRVIIFTL